MIRPWGRKCGFILTKKELAEFNKARKEDEPNALVPTGVIIIPVLPIIHITDFIRYALPILHLFPLVPRFIVGQLLYWVIQVVVML